MKSFRILFLLFFFIIFYIKTIACLKTPSLS